VETSLSFSRWHEAGLPDIREKFVTALSNTRELIKREQIADDVWVSKNARRVVDQIGALLEIAWLGELESKYNKEMLPAAIACNDFF
jgi:hypothetical protein